MADCIPDRQWQIVLAAVEHKRVPKDAFLAKVCKVYNDRSKDEAIAELIQYIEDDYFRDILVAFFLSGMPAQEISTFLRMDLATVLNFEKLMINPEEFRSKLDIFWYAEKYVDTVANSRGAQVVKSGIQLGPSGLIHQFTHGDEEIHIDAKKITKKMLQVAFTLSQLARGNPVNSPQVKEAFKWMGISSKMVKEAERIGADTTEESEAYMAVEERKRVRTAKEAGIAPDKILH
jgi:hypothetical protein